MKKTITNPDLANWIDLNEALRTASEEQALKLLTEEQAGRNRKQFVLRIHSRVNRMRAARERASIKGI